MKPFEALGQIDSQFRHFDHDRARSKTRPRNQKLSTPAAKRMAESGETRMPETLRTDTGSKKKSPHADRSLLEALNRSKKLRIPITSLGHQSSISS